MLKAFAFAALWLAVAQQGAAPTPATPSASAQTPSQTSPAPPPPSPPQGSAAGHGKHTITVKFDYDFSKTPPCKSKRRKYVCVERFVVYDISGGADPAHRYFLFYVAVPPKPEGLVKDITGANPDPIDFESGMHLIGVTAQDIDGKPLPRESSMSSCVSCTTWTTVP
jgi:hypothetical protein